jgi:hypothetical protein
MNTVKKRVATFLILLSIMLLCSTRAQLGKGLAEPEFLTILLSAEQQTNVTAHTGDIILSGNDVMVVKDARFELNGSLLMSGNSTLILDNAVWVPIISPYGNSYTMHDNSQLILRRGSQLQSAGIYDLHIYDNALINLTDSSIEKSVYGWPSSRVQMLNSNVSYLALDSDSRGRSSLLMVNSAGTVGCNGNTEIVNSALSALAVSLDARIVDSSIGSLVVRGGSSPNDGYFGPYVTCYLINSTYGSLDKGNFYNGTIYIEWQLTVSVESEGQPVEGANVQVYYSHNGSLAAQQTTLSNGEVQFDLPETEITPLGSIYLGNYTVKISCGATQAEENITLDSSKQITIPMQIYIPQFPTFLVLVLFVMISLLIILIVLLFRKKKPERASTFKLSI